MITLVYLENALLPQNRKVLEVKKTTIAEAAPTSWVLPFVAFLDGKPILRADWGMEVPPESSLAFIEVGAIPQGGGGSSNPLRMVLMIAVMVAAPYAAGAMLGTTAAAAAAAGGMTAAVFSATSAIFGMVGMALVNALVPVQAPTTQMAQAMAAPSPTYSVQSQGNSARLEAAIPEHFGRMICYPDMAAQPYTEYEDNEQYLYQLMCIGRGEYSLEDIKLEDSLLSDFDEASFDIVPPYSSLPSTFPSLVTNVEEVSSQELDNEFTGPFIINSVDTEINKVGLDFVAPGGLYYANDDGSLASKTVVIEVVVDRLDNLDNVISTTTLTPTGTTYSAWSDWTTIGHYSIKGTVPPLTPNTDTTEYRNRSGRVQKRTRTSYTGFTKTANTNTPQRWSLSVNLPSDGRYRVKVRRTDTKDESTRAAHTVVWTSARGYYPEDPSKNYGDTTLLAIKIRATNNISAQGSRKINVVATRKLPTWNGSVWSSPVPTRSPSWALAYACKQIGLKDSQIDLVALLNLHNTTNLRKDYFDGRFDNFVSFWEAITRICGAVRAKPFIQGGIVRIMRDQQTTVPVAMFSNRNMVKGSFSIDYLLPTEDTAEVVDIKYFDNTKWQPATISAWVGAPLNKPTSIPAKVDLFGVVDRNQAYREGLYQAACNKYRRKVIKFQTEMEGFIPSFGDLIIVQHDMPGWGQAGEVVSVQFNGSNTTLTLSEDLTWSTGSHYIGLRGNDGSVHGPYLVTPGIEANQVIYSTDATFTPYTGSSADRTQFTFGWAETWRQPARVLSVRPANAYIVEIECINEDNNVHTIDQGMIAPAIETSQLQGFIATPSVGLITVRPTVFDNTLTISWNPVPWTNEYIIQQSNDSGATWFDLGTTEKPYYISAVPYYSTTIIRVAAIGSLARGPWSESTQIEGNNTPAPNQPFATAEGGERLIHLAWLFGDTRSDIIGTEIWTNSVNNRDTATRIAVVPYPNQTYNYVNLAAGASGYFWIRIIDKYKSASSWYPTSATGGMYATALGYVIDLTPPPAPTYNSLPWGTSSGSAEAGISVISIYSDNAEYTTGHGHKACRLYGKTWAAGEAIPTFVNSTLLKEFGGSIDVYACDPATTYYLWLTWVSIDGGESLPSGGIIITTGQDVAKLLEVLTGEITESQLYVDLGSRIDLIDTPTTGLVDQVGAVKTVVNNPTTGVLATAASLDTVKNTVNNATTGVVATATKVSALESSVNSGTTGLATKASVSQVATAKSEAIAASASVTDAISARLNTGDFAAVQVQSSASASAVTGLLAQYTVKLDVGGKVSGYGLASSSASSEFAIRADRFYIAPPETGGGDAVQIIPFSVQATATTINGVSVPAGVYMDGAYIKDLTAPIARLGNAWVDDAKISSVSAGKLTAGTIGVGNYIQSTGYVAGSAGWKINADGTAEFQTAVVRGTVYANAGQIGGNTITSSSIASPLVSGYAAGTGFYLGSDGKARFGNPTGARIQWTGSAVEVYNASNTLTLSSGGVDWSVVSGKPTTLSDINATEATKLAGIAESAGKVIDGFRTAQFLPQDFSAGEVFYLQNSNNFSITGAGTYGTLRTNRPYSSGTDMSGGAVNQWFESEGRVWFRKSTSATTWGAWEAVPNGLITQANASTYIANAAIGNAQIGGDIYSSTWDWNNGWLLQRNGNLYAANAYIRGDVQATSLNAATGTFSGTLTASAINAVNTINIAGNAVTVSNSSSGVGYAATNVYVPSGVTAKVICIAVSSAYSVVGARSSYTHSVNFHGNAYSVVVGSVIYGDAENLASGLPCDTYARAIGVTGPATVTVTSTGPNFLNQTVTLLATFR